MTGRLYKPSPHGKGGPRQRRSAAFVSSTNAPLFSLHYPTVFHTIVTLSAPAGNLPLEGKAAIRDYHPLNRRHSTLVNLSAPQSTVIPSEAEGSLLHAAICTHAPSLKRHLGASFFAFPSPTVYRSAKKIPPLRSE